MDPQTRAKLQAELIAARDRQADRQQGRRPRQMKAPYAAR